MFKIRAQTNPLSSYEPLLQQSAMMEKRPSHNSFVQVLMATRMKIMMMFSV
jgi:hypothetical protein